uniref:EF-hand domain-containing protein n=1 Tax=Globodera rostochiensis TaxID=31243 RepID=A0A914GX43_GLORO
MDRPLSEECARGGADALQIFHDAFVTELGSELAEGRRLASLRELLDVIICAGKDCLIQDLLRLWPYATDKDEIFTFDECFQIYQSLPSTSVEELYDVFDAFSVEKCQCEDDGGGGEYGRVEFDYGTVMEQLATEGRGDVIKWLRRHLHRQTDIENLVYEVIECRKRLRSLNSQIVEENGFLARTLLKSSGDHPPPPPLVRANSLDERGERVVAGGQHKVSNVSSGSRHFHHSHLHFMMARSESAESLSSLFSNRNSRTTTLQGGGDDGVGMSTAGGQMPPQGPGDRGGAGGRVTADHQTSEERIQLKSMVIQRELDETSCIAYAFSLEKPRKMRLSVCVNEGIDHSLSRFHNSVIAIIMSSELEPQARIHAVARRKENGKCSTDWVSVPAGNHLVRVRFCRALKIMEPERSDQIVDDKGRLTKSFKCMLMNLFDMFDLDDDGLLSRREFEAYSILSGSGPVSEQEWTKICTNFELRQQHITMKTFIQMHQKESETYGHRGTMEEMWKAVRALGHNRRFIMSTMCPLRLELFSSAGPPLLMEPFRVDRFHADELDPLLAEHFWEQGKSLPYLREMQTLRQFKSDYYAVLLAGRTQSQTHYMLDMSSSNNVNIEGSELMVNQFVPANTLRILSVAIAQAESWFLSVKLAGYKLQSGRE